MAARSRTASHTEALRLTRARDPDRMMSASPRSRFHAVSCPSAKLTARSVVIAKDRQAGLRPAAGRRKAALSRAASEDLEASRKERSRSPRGCELVLTSVLMTIGRKLRSTAALNAARRRGPCRRCRRRRVTSSSHVSNCVSRRALASLRYYRAVRLKKSCAFWMAIVGRPEVLLQVKYLSFT